MGLTTGTGQLPQLNANAQIRTPLIDHYENSIRAVEDNPFPSLHRSSGNFTIGGSSSFLSNFWACDEPQDTLDLISLPPATEARSNRKPNSRSRAQRSSSSRSSSSRPSAKRI